MDDKQILVNALTRKKIQPDLAKTSILRKTSIVFLLVEQSCGDEGPLDSADNGHFVRLIESLHEIIQSSHDKEIERCIRRFEAWLELAWQKHGWLTTPVTYVLPM